MKTIFASVVISVYLLDVLSENPQIAPLNLWSHLTRRQAEGNEKGEAVAKGSDRTFVSSQEGYNEPLAIPTHQSINDSSQNDTRNLPSHLSRHQAERNEPTVTKAEQTIHLSTNNSSHSFPSNLPSRLSRRQAEKHEQIEPFAIEVLDP